MTSWRWIGAQWLAIGVDLVSEGISECGHVFCLLLRSSIHSLFNRNEKTDDPEAVHQKNFKIPAKTNSAATNIDQSEWHASQSAGLRASTTT